MNEITQLKHTTKTTPENAEVLVLDTGAVIDPEAEAMLQALHSRSIGGIKSHLEVLSRKGPEKFMSTYYVGYGHKSIGDLGSVTVFLEGISMLAAKAIQDWPLYSGQESSTRYIDFAEQPFMNPLDSKDGEKILENWRSFYLRGLEVLPEHLKRQFPRQTGEEEKIYNKAIQARAFDIMRSFLPAGAVTNIAWHSNLRQLADKLESLHRHPLSEVRNLASAIEEALLDKFPSSFSAERKVEKEDYYSKISELTYFDDPQPTKFEPFTDTVDKKMLQEYQVALKERPPRTELPKVVAECGQVGFRFLLDFGSFRDIQRHRAVTQRMPLLTTEHGFEEWYLDSLPKDLKQEAEQVIAEQKKVIEKLPTDPEVKQYYTAMGFNTTNRLIGNLPALVYLIELRSGRFVHPTLRKRARQMAEVLENNFSGNGLTLHLDPEPNRFDIKRGYQDIVEKE